jgi:hypothetical protein
MQHAKRVRRIMWYLRLRLWPVWLHISPHYSINGMIFRKKLLNMKCVLIFPTTLPQTFLVPRRIQQDIIVSLHRSSGNVPIIILLRF